MSAFDSRKFQDQAKDLIKRKGIKDIVFSDGSYQIEVYDNEAKTSFWPFIQLDDKGKVRDAFCSCATSEETGECLHLAAAHLAIFQSSDQPLANRFYQSFWHYLCFIASSRIGGKPRKLKKNNEGQYSFYSKTNKLLFSLKLFSKSSTKKFSEILFTPLADKEGASLKYSHLSEEEIKLWKKGEASREMNYELSFWSDLAKWWMFLQEQNMSYKIHFTDGDEHPPRIVNIHFPEVFESIFYISEKNWKYLIPTLRTVKSALKVIEEKEKKIHQILYHKDKNAFEIKKKKKAIHEKEKTGYQLGEWTYVKDIGFYRRSTDPIAEKKWIEKQEVSSYLTNHLGTFQKHLSDYEIHPLPIQAQYHIFFDKKKNLHIRIYLFNLEECSSEEAVFFCPWFFLPKRGFYLVDDPLFKEKETLILKENISSFVHEHRLWLHEFEGFHTHFGVLPTKFRYRLTQENNLEFFLKIELPQMPDKLVDFDDWLYVEGHGFYLKKETKTTLPLRPGLMIQEKEIPKFIDTHVEELEQIKGFFSESCPVEDAKISIYSSNHEIIVEPKIFLKEGYSFSDVKFFGDYLYVAGEGFSKIPAKANIPNRYQIKSAIAPEKISYFLNYELDRLKRYIGEIDPKLAQPTDLHLKIKKVQKEVKRGKTTWLVDLSYKSDLGEVSTIHLWEDVHSERLYSFTKAGAILLKQPRFNWLFQLTKSPVTMQV